jgi:phenylalanyl-tRNA synthetase beta chain
MSQPSDEKQSELATNENQIQPSELAPSGKYLNRVVVGEIVSITTILQSSGLKDITVNCGDKSYRTVCTTNELQVGMKTAFALLGARLNHNHYVQIQEVDGVESQGRLCTSEDLGIKNLSESIICFPPHLKNGIRVAELAG